MKQRAKLTRQTGDNVSDARAVTVAVGIGALLQYQADVKDHVRLLRKSTLAFLGSCIVSFVLAKALDLT